MKQFQNGLLVVVCGVSALVAAPGRASPTAVVVRETLEAVVKKGGGRLATSTAREAAERTLTAAVRRYGPRVGPLVADGGLELLEAAARHGDDVIAIAGKVGPAARRTLALESDRLVPLARRYGPEILNLEVKAPGLARRAADTFGADMVSPLARKAAASDLPRLVAAGERATSPAARDLLWTRYLEGGSQFLKRIDWRVVLATGLSVAAIDAAHRVTAPLAAAGDAIRDNPEAAQQLGGWMIWLPSMLWSATPLLIAACLLWRFSLMPWHRRGRRQRNRGGSTERSSTEAAW